MNVVRSRKRFDIVNFLPAILILVAVVLVVVLLIVALSPKMKSVKEGALKLLPFDKSDTYVAFGGGAAYIDSQKGEVYYVDDRGEIMWGYSGAVEGMSLYAGEDRVAVTVGKKIQVINREGILVFTKEFDRNIAGVAIGGKLMAVSLSDSDDTLILNGTGEEIDRIVSNVNCTNVRFGVYDNGSVWVISVENSGYKPKYQLSTYKYDNGKTQTVTFSDDSQMMYDAVFYDNYCCIFGTERLMIRDCDYTGSIHEDHNVNGFDAVSYGKIDKRVHVLLLNNGDLKAIGKKGAMDISCKEKLSFAVVSGKYYYGFSQYFMYKIKTNGRSTQYRFPVRVDNVVQGAGYVIIESGNALYRYDMSV